ncbi:hypothetical protein [Clostridium perfringens]|uniref:Uncharacterized protein n=1 Tax=Clostridium perfringens TaxID=1502 RepID=A0AAN5SG35_CLOPF|nr:hypothetical protein [Clostridium perfringens]MBO3323702.1 hypothetical protein [Clostridium perfringens]MBO3332743.1 hypothetical protein [Clostridium perfringens]MBO3392336.1 hypothetical protein [Clostridium perfringens]MBO3399415.1 hypothetical protein [Clostridium perfringens]MBO3408359.1 hypothetical protein [Clostridium perfringens]
MRVVTIISEKIENLIENKEISQEEVQNILNMFSKNDWGVLDSEEKEEQNELLIEGRLKGENPKLKYCFNGIYEVDKYLINTRSKYETLTKTLAITVYLVK